MKPWAKSMAAPTSESCGFSWQSGTSNHIFFHVLSMPRPLFWWFPLLGQTYGSWAVEAPNLTYPHMTKPLQGPWAPDVCAWQHAPGKGSWDAAGIATVANLKVQLFHLDMWPPDFWFQSGHQCQYQKYKKKTISKAHPHSKDPLLIWLCPKVTTTCHTWVGYTIN